jgi:hypothetical protein
LLAGEWDDIVGEFVCSIIRKVLEGPFRIAAARGLPGDLLGGDGLDVDGRLERKASSAIRIDRNSLLTAVGIPFFFLPFCGLSTCSSSLSSSAGPLGATIESSSGADAASLAWDLDPRISSPLFFLGFTFASFLAFLAALALDLRQD